MRIPGRRPSMAIVLAVLLVGAFLIGAQAPRATGWREYEQRLSSLEARLAATGPVAVSSSLYNDVRSFGAVGDGTHDDGPAIQKALDVLHDQGGGTLFFPAGKYRVTGNGLKLGSKISLQGVDSISSRIIFEPANYHQALINIHNDEGEYAPSQNQIINLRITAIGGAIIHEDLTPWTDKIKRGWHDSRVSNVVIEGGVPGGYAIDLPTYSQKVIFENVKFVDFMGPVLNINGNVNTFRNFGPDGFARGPGYANPRGLPMISIAGDAAVLDDCVIEAFSGCPALQLTGYRHRVMNMWAEADGPLPGGSWIVLNDAHHILFDWPHLLNPGTRKLKMVNSDATVLMLEGKHINGSLDMDAASSLVVVVAARSEPPGVHVMEPKPVK